MKRRLQEVILERKRKEAAASMGNLQLGRLYTSHKYIGTHLVLNIEAKNWKGQSIENEMGPKNAQCPLAYEVALFYNHKFRKRFP